MSLQPNIPPNIPILERKVQLLGISGHSGTGKSTICDHLLQSYSNTYQLAFADPLKVACVELFGMHLSDFYDSELKEQVHPVWGTSARKIAQFVGSEFFRDRIAQLIPWVGTDFWLHRFAGTINSRLYFPQDQDDFAIYDPTDTIVIPDVRFQNEYDFIIANGGVVLQVTREGKEGNVGIIGHQSEKGFEAHTPEQTVEFFNFSDSFETMHKGLDYLI
jgi:energy-coupling factor transporter ATP-binding protein EcfA2